MDHLFASVAVGGMPPALTPGAWDAAPLLLAVMLAAVLRRAGVRAPFAVQIVIVVVGGLVIDSIDDAVGISTATSVALLALGFALVGVRRARTA